MPVLGANAQQSVRRMDFDDGESKNVVIMKMRSVLAAGSGSTLTPSTDAIYGTSMADYQTAASSLVPADGVRFWRDPFGIVHLQGAAKWTGVVANLTNTNRILGLPIGYRPMYDCRFVIACNGGTGTTAPLAKIVVQQNGNIDLEGYTSQAAAAACMDLSGVSFLAEKITGA